MVGFEQELAAGDQNVFAECGETPAEPAGVCGVGLSAMGRGRGGAGVRRIVAQQVFEGVLALEAQHLDVGQPQFLDAFADTAHPAE